MFQQGMFTIDANSTPEQIAQKRAMIAALMPRFGDAKYVGQGLGQLFTGVAMGQQRRKLDQAETQGRQSAQDRFNAILGGGIQGRAQPGSLSVLGPMPAPDPNSPHALGNDTMKALGKAPIATGADPASIRQGLIARGLPEHVADGFVMNMKDESGLNPGINEIAPLVPGSRGGFGLYQLTGPRRVAYEQWATQNGFPLDSVDAQLDFLMMELQGPEAAAAQRIMAAPDAGSAAAAIVTDFLRPSPEHRDRRVAEYTGGVMSDAMASPQMAAATVPMDALISIISDPWATPEQRQMAQTMLDQQTQMNDPAYRMGLRADELAIQKAERELAQMDQPQPGFVNMTDEEEAAIGLNPAGVYQRGADGSIKTIQEPAGAGSLPADFQSLKLRAEAAGLVEGTPEYQAFMRQGIDGGAPAAFVALDMQAQAAGFTPGTPEYQEFMATRGSGLSAEAATRGKATAEAELAAPADISSAETTLSYITSLRDHPGRQAGSGASSWLGNIPGTDAREFQIEVERLKAGAFLTAIDQLKGMGALSNAEGQTATAAVAALDPNGTEEGFLKRLAEYEEIVNRGLERARNRVKPPEGQSEKTRLRFNPATQTFEAVQ